jgi:hypothetical protein
LACAYATFAPILVDGYSHFPNFVADTLEFGPGDVRAEGIYVYTVSMTDATGNGWNVSIRFRVNHGRRRVEKQN